MFDRVLNTPLYKTVCKPPAFSFQKLNEKAKLAQYNNIYTYWYYNLIMKHLVIEGIKDTRTKMISF